MCPRKALAIGLKTGSQSMTYCPGLRYIWSCGKRVIVTHADVIDAATDPYFENIFNMYVGTIKKYIDIFTKGERKILIGNLYIDFAD